MSRSLLPDGGDTVRIAQLEFGDIGEYDLDWFHIAMRAPLCTAAHKARILVTGVVSPALGGATPASCLARIKLVMLTCPNSEYRKHLPSTAPTCGTSNGPFQRGRRTARLWLACGLITIEGDRAVRPNTQIPLSAGAVPAIPSFGTMWRMPTRRGVRSD